MSTLPAVIHKPLTREEYDKRIQDIEAVKAQMPEKLLKVAQDVQGLLDETIEHGLRRLWRIGEKVYDVLSNDNENVYGAKAMDRLAFVLGRSSAVLYSYSRFYQVYNSKQALDELISLRISGSNTALSWEQVEPLLKIKDDEQRERYVHKVVEQGLDADDLRGELLHDMPELFGKKKAASSKSSRNMGNKIKAPKTVIGVMHRLSKHLELLLKEDRDIYSNAKHNVLDSVDDIPTDKLTDTFVEAIDSCVAVIEEVLEVLPKIKDNLVEARVVVTERMQAQQEQTSLPANNNNNGEEETEEPAENEGIEVETE